MRPLILWHAILFQNGIRPILPSEPISRLLLSTNGLGINSGEPNTDLVVLSTIFPGPMTSFFVSQRLPLPTSILQELITVTDTETDADFDYFEWDRQPFRNRRYMHTHVPRSKSALHRQAVLRPERSREAGSYSTTPLLPGGKTPPPPHFQSYYSLRTKGILSPDFLQGKTKGQQLKGKIVSNVLHTFRTFSHFFRIFPPGLSPSKQRVLAQWEQKRRKDNKKNWTNRCCTLVVARLASSNFYPKQTVFWEHFFANRGGGVGGLSK